MMEKYLISRFPPQRGGGAGGVEDFFPAVPNEGTMIFSGGSDHAPKFRRCCRTALGLFVLTQLLPRLAVGAPGRLQEPPVAVPVEPAAETRFTTGLAPSSALDTNSALIAATAIAFQIKGAQVMTVAPTGSMRPIFDEKAYVVVEPASFEDLRVGDIVTYLHPNLHQIVVHRILEQRGDSFWTKGDHNDRMDNVYVTRENYLMRVFAIIYARESTTGRTSHSGQATASKVAGRKAS